MRKATVMIISAVLFFAIIIVGTVVINNRISDAYGENDNGTKAPSTPVNTGDKEYEIYLVTDEFCTVTSANPVKVKEGEVACFNVVFSENYQLDTTSAEYENGKILVKNCTADATHTVTSRSISQFYFFDYASPAPEDGVVECSKPVGAHLANQQITLTAKPSDGAYFTGWSVGGTVLNGGTMVSYSQSYTFKLISDVKLYPNFLKEGYAFIKYHLNGGLLSATGSTDDVLVQVNTDIKPCPNLMADTGAIVRDGYTLLEFTTEQDGGGIAINPGGLADIPDSGMLEVWAQWSEWTDESEFEFVEESDFVTLKLYSGASSTVSVPEYVNGKPVRDISAAAFVNKPIETLILPKTIRSVESGAFVGCNALDTLYIFDTLTSIPDSAFTDCRAFTKLRLNAGRNPSYPVNAESVATRLGYIMTRENYSKKPIMLLVGGSSALYGFDTPYLQELLNNDYLVINCGTNAGGLGMLYIEALTSFMRAGDVVIDVPEFGNVQFGDNTFYWRTFRATEACYNIYRYVDFSKYKGFFSAMSEFNSSKEARASLPERSYDIKNTSLTYIHCDLAGKHIYNSERPVYSPISLSVSQITDSRVETFNRVIAVVESKGISIYVASPPVYKQGLKATESDMNSFAETMNERLNAPYISNPNDYLYEDSLYYDSQYHLTDEGARMRTEQLAEDYLTYLESH